MVSHLLETKKDNTMNIGMNFFDYFQNYYIDRAFGWTYIITELLSCFIVSFSFNKLEFKNFKSYLKLLIDFICTWIVQLLLASFFNYVLKINNQDTTVIRYFIWPLVALIHTIYPKKIGKYPMRFLCCVFSSTFLFMAINLSGCIGNIITDYLGHYPDNLLMDYTLYIIFFGLFVVSLFFEIMSPFKYKYVKTAPIILIDIVFILSYAITVCTCILNNQSNQILYCVLYSFLLVICFLCYTIFYLSVKSYNNLIDYQVKAIKAESQVDQLKISKSQYEELHRIRHELKNQMSLLETLFKEKKYDEMNEYFSDICEKVHVEIDYIDSGNSIVNSILNMELSKAKGLNIPFNTHLSLKDNLNINPQDLTSLLTNLIDNALEAECRCDSHDPVDLHMIIQNDYLFIKVTNTILVDDNSNLLSLTSQKPDRKNHGYGTKIIKSICEKYNGYSKFSIVKDKFQFDGMLYLKKE